ncbi:MAG: carbohydrate binding domain-containing protein [Anaerolineales bacterium]|nr:carbohydrate binding domain-containing protein [Anaerolineales bacterium]
MPSIPVNTPFGYTGVFFLIIGLVLIIAGLGIVKIEKLIVVPGRKTWVSGLVVVVFGIGFLVADTKSINKSDVLPSPTPLSQTTVTPFNTSIPTSTDITNLLPTTTLTSVPPTEVPIMPTITLTLTPIPNLIRNPGFEEDYQIGWNSGGSIEVERSTDSYDSQYALCFAQKGTEAKKWVIVDQIVKIEANTQYQITVQIKSTNVVNFHIRFDWYNNDTFISGEQVGPTFNGETIGWQAWGQSRFAPSDATHVKVRFFQGLDSDGEAVMDSTVCIDDVTLIPIP